MCDVHRQNGFVSVRVFCEGLINVDFVGAEFSKKNSLRGFSKNFITDFKGFSLISKDFPEF